MSIALTYTIKFVADMDAAVQFHNEQLGPKLRFQSPEWSEFDTGQTTLALHKASAGNSAGSCQLGFRVDSVDKFYEARVAEGVHSVEAPKDLHGQRMAKLRDPDGAEFTVSGS